MLGKTHAVVGIAAGLLAIPPFNMRDLVIGAGASALGALICDIDVGTSRSHRDADAVTGLAVLSVLGIGALDWVFRLGIYNYLMRDSNVARILVGALAFIGICAYGKEQPHRSFMHSLLALVLLGGCVGTVFPAMLPYFAVGFASHVATDLLNYKGVMLFYPWRNGYCLKLCHAHGYANDLLFLAGSIVSVAVAGYYALQMLHINLQL